MHFQRNLSHVAQSLSLRTMAFFMRNGRHFRGQAEYQRVFDTSPLFALGHLMFILAINARPNDLCFVGRSRGNWRTKWFLVIRLLSVVLPYCGEVFSAHAGVPDSGLSYTNYRVADVPWSIHVVRMERSDSHFEIHSTHAGGGALGLSTLSDQIKLEEFRHGG